MRPPVKRITWVGGAVLGLLIAAGTGVWIAGNSDGGRALIERLTYRLSGGTVRLVGLRGDFPAQLTLERLELRDALGVWLSADRVAVRWSPLALLERRIQVDELKAGRVHMERTPVAGKSGGAATVPHIEVGRFTLEEVELGAPLAGTPATLTAAGNLQLRSLGDAGGELVARRKDGEGEYRLRLRLDSRRIDGELSVHEPADGPLENMLSLPGLGALSATVTLAGPRNGERIDAVMNAGGLHAELRGSVDLKRESADLDFSLKAPGMAPRPLLSWDRLSLEGHWHGPWTGPAASGRLEAGGLRVAGDTRIAELQADLSGSAGKLSARSVINGLEIPGPQPRLLAADPVTIDASILLREASRPLALTASHRLFDLHARADTAPGSAGRRATATLRLADIQPFAAIVSQDDRGTAIIDAELTHTPTDDALTLDAGLGLSGGTAGWLALAGPRPHLTLSGVLSEEGVRIRSLRLDANAATLTASGTAARIGGAATVAGLKDIDVAWQLEAQDLHRLSEDVAGDLKASGQLSGSPAALAADADVTSSLSIRGSPTGTVEARVHMRGLPKAPAGTVQAHGMLDGAPLMLDAAIDRSGDHAYRLRVRQADWKSAHIDGEATSDAEMTGSRGQLRLRMGDLADLDRLLGQNLSGSVDASLSFAPGHANPEAHFDLNGRDLRVGRVAGDVHLQAAGPADALGVQLSATLPTLYGAPAAVSAAASLNLVARELRISSFSADYRSATLRLLAPASLSFASGVSVDDLKLGANGAVVELSGQLAPALDLRASVSQVGPGVVNLFAPGLLAGGAIEARARLRGSPSSPAGRIRLDANGLKFADDAAVGLPPLDIHARAQLADDTATIEATLNAGSGSQLTASGAAPLNAGGAMNLKLGGKLDVSLANPLLEARGLRATGALTVAAALRGSADAPRVSGGITLSAGSLRDYVHGVNLTEIQAQIDGGDSGLQIKTFTARAASGTLAMSGTFDLLQHGIPVDVRITADKARPIASSLITAVLDADLHVRGTALERLDVAGTVHVDRATIGIPDTLPPEVAVLDVRRRGQSAPAPVGDKLVVGLDVVVRAPQQILVEGRGLNAELGGDIHLSGTFDDPQVSGGFDLQRGSFTIAGNKLNLTPPGRVGFDGAGLRKRIDPTLDFTATSTVSSPTVSNATVTLKISGLADAPQFEFTSNPTLPQDEIMALLLFGESAAQLTALQAAEIGAALATLSGIGGGGANPLVKLQKTLGLDRLSVGANTTTTATGATENSGAAIAAGRYVSKRVYVEGKQTTAGTSQVQVDVDLTKHLKLQTRLGNGTAAVQGTSPENDPGSSVGLSYQFEY